MPAETAELEMTTTRCFRSDTTRIKSLGERLETLEKSGFSSQHTIHRALNALEREIEAAEAAKAAA